MGVQHVVSLHCTPLPFKIQHEEGPVPGGLMLWVSSAGSEFGPDVWCSWSSYAGCFEYHHLAPQSKAGASVTRMGLL